MRRPTSHSASCKLPRQIPTGSTVRRPVTCTARNGLRGQPRESVRRLPSCRGRQHNRYRINFGSYWSCTVTATVTVNNGGQTLTTTYGSYPGSAQPTSSTSQDHKIVVGGNGIIAFNPPEHHCSARRHDHLPVRAEEPHSDSVPTSPSHAASLHRRRRPARSDSTLAHARCRPTPPTSDFHCPGQRRMLFILFSSRIGVDDCFLADSTHLGVLCSDWSLRTGIGVLRQRCRERGEQLRGLPGARHQARTAPALTRPRAVMRCLSISTAALASPSASLPCSLASCSELSLDRLRSTCLFSY